VTIAFQKPAATPLASDEARSFGALGLARRCARSPLRRVVAAQLARVILRLCFAGAVAAIVGRLVMSEEASLWLVLAAPLLLVLAAAAGADADRAQANAETRVATDLREAVGRRLVAMPARRVQSLPAGRLIVSAQRHPEAVAALVVGHQAATLMMAAGPLAAASALALVSWPSALTVLALTPVMIVFFVLLGETIRRRAQTQEEAFGYLAGQFADRLRALPTILANDALAGEEAKLTRRLTIYAARTMEVLRIAFLNAAAIDFFTSLSIAMLAVFLGLGHLGLATMPGFSHLELWRSMFILMIAPEYFSSFRRYAEQYHAKAEGLAGAAALDRLLDDQPLAELAAASRGGLRIEDLPPRGLVVITGPSGVGKTVLLRRLAGVDRASGRDDACAGFPAPVWVSTDSFVPSGTLEKAIAWNVENAPRPRVLWAAEEVGLLDDERLPGGLDARIDKDGANLSGGQRLRVAVARALLNERPVFADEPTAKLDPLTADKVRRALRGLAERGLVVTASHDAALAALADRVETLSGDPAQEDVQ